MTQEALKMALDLATMHHTDDGYAALRAKVRSASKEALAQTEQEPVAWLLTDKNINSLQVDSIQRLINRLKHAHHIDIRVRINGHDEWFEADWLKHMVRVTPPQRTWVGAGDLENSNAYLTPPQPEPVIDKSAAKRIATALGWTPQRTWVGLTDEEIIDVLHPLVMADMSDEATDYEIARAIEAKLKERNQ